jgi:hypothetical protein
MRSIYNVAYNLGSLASNREVSTEIVNRVSVVAQAATCYGTRHVKTHDGDSPGPQYEKKNSFLEVQVPAPVSNQASRR